MSLAPAERVHVSLLGLKGEVEADPAALARILGFLQVFNIVPRRAQATLPGAHGRNT